MSPFFVSCDTWTAACLAVHELRQGIEVERIEGEPESPDSFFQASRLLHGCEVRPGALLGPAAGDPLRGSGDGAEIRWVMGAEAEAA